MTMSIIFRQMRRLGVGFHRPVAVLHDLLAMISQVVAVLASVGYE
jgi:hypothetical protein